MRHIVKGYKTDGMTIKFLYQLSGRALLPTTYDFPLNAINFLQWRTIIIYLLIKNALFNKFNKSRIKICYGEDSCI